MVRGRNVGVGAFEEGCRSPCPSARFAERACVRANAASAVGNNSAAVAAVAMNQRAIICRAANFVRLGSRRQGRRRMTLARPCVAATAAARTTRAATSTFKVCNEDHNHASPLNWTLSLSLLNHHTHACHFLPVPVSFPNNERFCLGCGSLFTRGRLGSPRGEPGEVGPAVSR